MAKSNAVQHRIMTTFATMEKWKDYELVLSKLISFFEGEKIHLNEDWKQSRGHSSLIANKEGRKVLKILKTVDVSVQFGNDAPRGGAVGAYFKCVRKNTAAATFFANLLFLHMLYTDSNINSEAKTK